MLKILMKMELIGPFRRGGVKDQYACIILMTMLDQLPYFYFFLGLFSQYVGVVLVMQNSCRILESKATAYFALFSVEV